MLMAHAGAELISREQLAELETPASTPTHQVISHVELVNQLTETLGFLQLN